MPTAVICTEQFVSSVRAQAEICGNPLYPFAVVAHPIGSLSKRELEERADSVVPRVVAILTGAL